ncbi:hypothetical protein BMR05_12640 [Methylococcaceae bacterium HT4]|uniref:hypothetical protein n=1 Tax=Bathymodiolus platifrons methanotrophic gill symbiont TaxID=113268 RepID=UPI0011C8018F|nr:hypothetical protein [Bathymodiolus platifrons methanotrophic gill symbiont]TXK99093.1 hypothetical protein BMR11_07045 [Methylococcaceae bacterium CS5]TXL04072.1 hypothetical protein BMR07_13445 [Methylococcaceae bacterium CS1]TXL06672.1 hypothetical protein BMR09_07675 [Methylococcaceae bacterium CS3]TXL10806.1 hypothetical protein BMR08_07525 [Methylococcaceae bacterium CS2]TXL13170.1 hypothetical protein BMR05_12640 [Methylococcaceae bacterium HT4]TXL19212.1 hypothetical protein BMR06_
MAGVPHAYYIDKYLKKLDIPINQDVSTIYREQLSLLVSQYDDPEGIFKNSVGEFITMYQLRHDQDKLIDYLLLTEYAPDTKE